MSGPILGRLVAYRGTSGK